MSWNDGWGLRIVRGIAFAVLMSSGAAACGDDEGSPDPEDGEDAGDLLPDAGDREDAGGDREDAGSDGGDTGSDAGKPLYALASYVFDDTTTSTYLTLLDSIGERDDIELADAREFSGWANPGAFDGNLFMSSSEQPEMTRYSVSSSGALGSAETLSFANFTSDSAPMFANFFVDRDTALITLDRTTRVLWNPSAFEIIGEADEVSVELTRDGMSVAAYAHRDGVRPDGVFQSYYWHDADWYAFHPSSQIAVYDNEDASLKKLIDVACPALHLASADEDGNLYFSPVGDIIAYQLLEEDAPASCAVRIDAGEQKIADGWPRDLTELTEGRPTGELRYLRDGFAVLSVYHKERATIGPDVVSTDLIADDNWRFWLVDLDGWTAEPIEDLEWLAGGSHLSTVDGRAFLFSTSSDFSSTTVYELSADAHATRLFETPGYAEKFLKLR